MIAHLGRRAHLRDAPVLEQDEAVGQRHRLDGIVRDEDGRSREGRERVAEQRAEPRTGRGVDGGERFVEQQEAGLARKRPGERHPLTLAARQLRGAHLGIDAGGQLGEQPRCARAGRRRPFPSRARRERHVLLRAHTREEHAVLEGEADPAALGCEPFDPNAVQFDGRVIHRDQSGKRLEHRCLAGSVAPDERDGLAVGRVEIDFDGVVAATDP